MINYQEVADARKLIRAYEEQQVRHKFDGANWPLYFNMKKLEQELFYGIRRLPNVREINAIEFAAHPAISGSYGAKYLGDASAQYMEGIKFARYARVLMVTSQDYAGMGVAFVAVPADENEWNKSQHTRVDRKLRHWSFHICDHKYGHGKRVGNCSTNYSCEECGWTLNVDSSG